jgi:glycosyltransferase involved in cell wall biosynthesis
MDRPTVSVCMITYNHEKYIIEAINGVLMQETDFKIELIIANDASTDTTHEVISNLISSYSGQIKINYFHHSQNKGMMKNFVFALEQCKGKYIALCEGDDYWTEPLKLQKQVDFLEDNDKFIGVFHKTEYLNESSPLDSRKSWRDYDRDVFYAVDTFTKFSLFHTSSYCFRNLRKIDYSLLCSSKIVSGDMALLGVMAKYGKLKLIDQSMSVYRRNQGGITNRDTKISYHTHRITLIKFLNNYYNGEYKDRAQEIIKFHTNELNRHNPSAWRTMINRIKKRLRLK